MKQNIYFFQPQYSINYKGTPTYWLPYSVGCIWSYLLQFPDITDNYELKDIVFRREPLEQVIARIENPNVCGFSCYVWNEKYCLAVAELIKKTWPACHIVFGGPNAHSGMLKYDYVDTIVSGEGEMVFADVLRHHLTGKPPELFWPKKRVEDLTHVPSPYLTGVFDTLIKANPDAMWNMVLETNRGCPYQCTFCDWGSLILSKVKKFTLDRVKAETEWAAKNRVGYIFVADANFGIFKERDLEIAKMIRDAANIPESLIDGLNIQYAKNSTHVVYEIAKIMEESGLGRGITVSVQSMNEDTLDAIKRKNLGINDIKSLMAISEKTNIATYTEFILGLPLETLTTWKKGLTNILELGQHNSIELWFAQVLVNSELGQPESKRKYGIKTVTAKDYYPMLDENDCRDIVEEIEIINQTNTMSTEDMVEAYMYAWMIIHFHVAGYTQLYAKYARHMHDISYEQFYKTLWEQIKTVPVLEENYSLVRNTAEYYLKHGDLLNFEKVKKGGLGHGLHGMSYDAFYINRQEVYNLGLAVLESLTGTCPKNLKSAQEHFVFDIDQQYPLQLDFDYSLYSFKPGKFKYNFDSKIDINELGKMKIRGTIVTDESVLADKKKIKFDLYAIRRRGLIKNKLEEFAQ
jgi:hypothetical protein